MRHIGSCKLNGTYVPSRIEYCIYINFVGNNLHSTPCKFIKLILPRFYVRTGPLPPSTVLSKPANMSRTRTPISSNWEWKLANAHQNATALKNPALQSWMPVSQFPSVIQLELLHSKLIPDPNVGENERLIQWVGECDWEYRCSFPSLSNVSTLPNVELIFEGLDTFATVFLNGKEILKSENMFLPARVDVKALLKTPGEENELSILFESALRKGTELEEKFGNRASMMRDKRRLLMRKAQVRRSWLYD
jgi:beta-mannosidase